MHGKVESCKQANCIFEYFPLKFFHTFCLKQGSENFQEKGAQQVEKKLDMAKRRNLKRYDDTTTEIGKPNDPLPATPHSYTTA